MGVINLTLPIPPTINTRYVNRFFATSKEYKRYKDKVAMYCIYRKIRPFLFEVEMKIVWYRTQRRGDIDSRIKALLDSLNGYAYKDDRQIRKLSIERFDGNKHPRLEVRIKEST